MGDWPDWEIVVGVLWTGTVKLPMTTSGAWDWDPVPEDGLAEGMRGDGPVDADGALDGALDGTLDGVPEGASDGASDEVSDETSDEVPDESLGVSDAALPGLLREERPGLNVPEFPDWIRTEVVEEVSVAEVVTDAGGDADGDTLADVSPRVTVTVRTLGSTVTVETLSQVSKQASALASVITFHDCNCDSNNTALTSTIE
jgi:hypothetical protein